MKTIKRPVLSCLLPFMEQHDRRYIVLAMCKEWRGKQKKETIMYLIHIIMSCSELVTERNFQVVHRKEAKKTVFCNVPPCNRVENFC
jgi:hypothetical protein